MKASDYTAQHISLSFMHGLDFHKYLLANATTIIGFYQIWFDLVHSGSLHKRTSSSLECAVFQIVSVTVEWNEAEVKERKRKFLEKNLQ